MNQKKRLSVRWIAAIVILAALAFPGHGQAGRILSAVGVQPLQINASKIETSTIQWHQSHQGSTSVLICDLNGMVVKSLLNRADMPPGVHTAAWDGRDDAGKMCPDGAYIPIIKVQTPKKGSDIFNPTFSPWGLRLVDESIAFDPDAKEIRFRLSGPSICQIRAGEANGGPCYRTLTDWEPLSAGEHRIPWDGVGAGAVFNVWETKQFALVLDAFSVPQKSILLTGSDTSTRTPVKAIRRFPIKPPHGGQIFLHAMHRRDRCHDMTIHANFDQSQMTQEGHRVLSGQARLTVSAGPDVNTRMLQREQFEFYVFSDGQLLSEGPQTRLPAVIDLDTTAMADGKHIITVNLRTSEDHLGAYSIKVWVQNQSKTQTR